MNTAELKRYDRQMILPELGLDGQLKLMNSKVLVVGAGGLGCPALLYLVAAGLGKIGIVDHDTVDETNLHRQILFNRNDLGKLKAELAVQKLTQLNPDVHLVAYPLRLIAANAREIISGYDVVIDGSDNFSTRYLVNDTCVALNKPLVFGSIFQFEGQIAVFNHLKGPDYRSLYPEPPAPDEVQNCAEAGVIGTLPGTIGTMMANETIKVLTGIGKTLSGELLIFNMLNNNIQIFPFSKTKVKKQPVDATKKNAAEIQMTQLEAWNALNIPFQIVDIRERYEFEENNIGGISIPLYELSSQLDQLADQPKIVFCCTSGLRSRIAVNLIPQKNNQEVFTLILPQDCKI
ncbi:HesA/MoeB/ThiF family protein [Pedobacter sp. MC2016-24]|uniref:HesA/MoeB/ThiF family protein n=1 Tax=Pedobacter sp. MC2016-24 TaxID=2780090 RepID=UPI00187E31E0|nr:HesA/MoeB/ThiF family protein [Pedobacter sp. MC2016-24]MBE9598324.1 HesA/MoeB/ThiF family protein [Pedobacter sp. MC2016-24]